MVRLLEKNKRTIVYVDFAETVGAAREIELVGLPTGTDYERFKSKARDFLTNHLDHVALQRLREISP